MRITGQAQRTINIDDEEYDLLKITFRYFASRTNGTCSQIFNSHSSLNLIIQERVQQYFTRAVISLLLCDPDDYMKKVILTHISKGKKPTSEERNERCDNCGDCFSSTKKCSDCQNVQYCSKKCQRQHWKLHKADCKKTTTCMKQENEKRKEAISTTAEIIKTSAPPFPLTRYWYGGDFNFYYAYGNTPAEDFLQNCPGVKEPAVLLLGCGDIRSCFYTLWKQFDSTAPQQFNGVHFVLNDWSTSVLARNIVFLYLCLNLPSEERDKGTWFCAMWAIWYCHELYAEHQKVLDDCLRVLLKYSLSLEQWASAGNSMQRFVKFTSSATLKKISGVWECWLKRKYAVFSVQQMYTHRQSELVRQGVLSQLENVGFSIAHSKIAITGDTSDVMSKVVARSPEVIAYIKCGNCYAENVVKNMKFLNSTTTVNLTLYERPDGVYTLHYGSIPYIGYHHTVDFSPDTLTSSGVKKSVCATMLVESKSFQTLPFLANSVQQFTMWIQSASKVLNSDSINISFTFNNLNAVSFCQELQQKTFSACRNEFDLIHASNLMDHMGPSGVILPSIPLLKPSGLFFASTLISKGFTNTIEDYLRTCIGFDCKLLPVILGVRCINHEGAGYCSSVMIEPSPVEIGDLFETKQHERMLIWEKVSAQHSVLSQLPPLAPNNITDALFDCIKTAALALLTSYDSGQAIMNNNSLDTALSILKTFLSSVESCPVNSSLFCEPLVSALRIKLKPFLDCLQTQSLLHNLHIHFTLSSQECPKCTNKAVQEHVGLFCAEVPLPIRYRTPHFIALIHKYSSSDAQYLCNEAMSGKDVHIFDCMDGSVEDKVLKLHFFAPIKYTKQDYQVTLGLTFLTEHKNRMITALQTSSMKSLQVPFMPYSFSEMIMLPQAGQENHSFGQLISHFYNGDQVQSEFSLSETMLQTLAAHNLQTKQISPTELQLSCGSLYYNLTFLYPVDYNQINIKLSKAKGKISVVCKRGSHNFDKEKPLYITIPDHQLSLPPQPMNDSVIISHSGMQMLSEERKIVDDCDEDSQLPPLLNVKKAMMFFFQGKKNYFHICSPHSTAICGLVVLNQCLFDYQHRTPTMDLAFCFLDQCKSEYDAGTVVKVWKTITRDQDGMNITLSKEGFELFQSTLLYFSKRTNGNCRTSGKNSRYHMLCQKKLDQYFHRAVVYLLFRDSDNQGLNMNSTSEQKSDFLKAYYPKPDSSGNPATDEKCDYCSKYSPDIKKCTRCKEVQYCSKECQTKHWPVHSSSCKAPSISNVQGSKPVLKESSATGKPHFKSTDDTRCSYCNEVSESLKKCIRCKEVQYCGRECQANHWPMHKTECKKLSQLLNSHGPSTETKPKMDDAEVLCCAFCGNSSVKLMACGSCGKVKYCRKECQRKHWKTHKTLCHM